MANSPKTDRPQVKQDSGSFLSSLIESIDINKVAPKTKELGAELLNILKGQSNISASKRDWRFKDEAWQKNPAYKRLGQSYLAVDHFLKDIIDKDADWRTQERAKFIAGIISSTIAPTNTLPGNPAALKEAINTRGESLLKGANHLMEDLKSKRSLPSMVDDTSFVKGENICATPGAVIFRNQVLELIQYTATTAKVSAIPLLLIPPQINKFYVLDLSPGRSLVEYLVSQGIQPFVVSWKNPSTENANWDLDAYVTALYEAVDAILHITKSTQFNSIGFCAGGITQSVMLAHMAARNDKRCKSFCNCVTLLDWSTPGILGMLQDDQLLKVAGTKSEADGIIRGQDLGNLFAWVRPNELIWNYWVSNYLMGKTPPSFDILAWNADVTNLPARLHNQFLDVFSNNSLTKAGSLEVLGENIDISKIDQDAYIIGGLTDHLTPWYQCYRSAHLFGSKNIEYILNEGGHIVTIVNPTGSSKSAYYKGESLLQDPEDWREHADRHQGSWWKDYANWLKERSGDDIPAPKKPGNNKYKNLISAPGEYIHG